MYYILYTTPNKYVYVYVYVYMERKEIKQSGQRSAMVMAASVEAG